MGCRRCHRKAWPIVNRMSSALFEQLHGCTVRVVVCPGEGETWGTGFFAARGRILTCAHVVVVSGRISDDIWIFHEDGRSAHVTVESENLFASDYPDLALLNVDLARYPAFQDHPCVTLHPAVRPHDDVYTYGFGYTKTRRPGASMTAEVEGWAQPGGQTDRPEKLIQLKQGQVLPGLSGAPLLNLRTGAVCGVVKATRDNLTDLGGWAIPARTVLERYRSILSEGADRGRLYEGMPPRALREDLAPKLYDREVPDDDFAAWLLEQLGPTPCTRAYLAFGEEHEQHSSFAERVGETSLQFVVNGRFKEREAVVDRVGMVDWPAGELFSDHLKNKVGVNLAKAIGVSAKVETGWDLLSISPGRGLYPVVFIPHILRVERWSRAQMKLLAWYLDVFWDDTARTENHPYVVLLLLVECSEDMAVPGFAEHLLFWRGSAKDRLRRDLRALEQGSYGKGLLQRLRLRPSDAPLLAGAKPARGCSRVLLTELTPLDLDDITNWYERHLAARARLSRYRCEEKATLIFNQAKRRRNNIRCTDHIESLLQEAYAPEDTRYAEGFHADA